MNKKTARKLTELLDIIAERADAAYEDLVLNRESDGPVNSSTLRLMIWESNSEEIYEAMSGAMEAMTQVAHWVEVTREFVKKENKK